MLVISALTLINSLLGLPWLVAATVRRSVSQQGTSAHTTHRCVLDDVCPHIPLGRPPPPASSWGERERERGEGRCRGLNLTSFMRCPPPCPPLIITSLNHVKALANFVKNERTGELRIASMMENRLTGKRSATSSMLTQQASGSLSCVRRSRCWEAYHASDGMRREEGMALTPHTAASAVVCRRPGDPLADRVLDPLLPPAAQPDPAGRAAGPLPLPRPELARREPDGASHRDDHATPLPPSPPPKHQPVAPTTSQGAPTDLRLCCPTHCLPPACLCSGSASS